MVREPIASARGWEAKRGVTKNDNNFIYCERDDQWKRHIVSEFHVFIQLTVVVDFTTRKSWFASQCLAQETFNNYYCFASDGKLSRYFVSIRMQVNIYNTHGSRRHSCRIPLYNFLLAKEIFLLCNCTSFNRPSEWYEVYFQFIDLVKSIQRMRTLFLLLGNSQWLAE